MSDTERRIAARRGLLRPSAARRQGFAIVALWDGNGDGNGYGYGQ